jgi:hypothetical protein
MAAEFTELRLLTLKVCSDCRLPKPLEAYSDHRMTACGKFPYCKACAVDRTRAWRVANPERYHQQTMTDSFNRKLRSVGLRPMHVARAA